MDKFELLARLKKFALRVVPLCDALPKVKLSGIIEYQLLKSSFSAAANYRASCNAQSKAAFISKLSISLEEMDESVFWLEMIRDANLLPQSKMEAIIEEGIGLTKILAASRRTAKIKN